MGSYAAREVCTGTVEARAGLGARLGEIPAASAGMTEAGAGPGAELGEIPAASAGMTEVGAGMAEMGAGVAKLEGRGSVNTP